MHNFCINAIPAIVNVNLKNVLSVISPGHLTAITCMLLSVILNNFLLPDLKSTLVN